MLDFLATYSISEIIIFVILFCLAIKEAVTFYDWSKNRVQQVFKKETEERDNRNKLQYEIEDMEEYFKEKELKFNKKKEEINEGFKKIDERIDFLATQIELLIASDKDSIKAYITEKHHYYCYDKKWIDDYTLDCLEKRYSHYIDEGGNSFVADLMKDLRALPHQPPQ